MSEQNSNSAGQVSRRKFLRTLAIAGGSAAIPAGFSSLAQAFAPGGPARLRVGVALPAFGQNGALTASMLNGLRMALAAAPEITLNVVTAGTVISRIKALAKSEPDLIIGAVTPHASHTVGKDLGGRRTVLLNVEPGAHILRIKDRQPNVFHHTLQLWQASYAAGVSAVTTHGRRGALLTSYRESGYDTNTAFIAGFESAGGVLVAQEVSHVPGRTAALPELLGQLRGAKPDFIYVNATGIQSDELMAAAGPDAVAAPHAQAGGRMDPQFAATYRQAIGTEADAYALLGFEAGQLVLAAATDMAASGHNLGTALRHASFAGPRGKLHMQPDTQTTTGGAYVDQHGAALTVASIDEREALAHASWPLAISGWSLPHAAMHTTSRV